MYMRRIHLSLASLLLRFGCSLPTIEAKETYYRGKRDLLYRQKRPSIDSCCTLAARWARPAAPVS